MDQTETADRHEKILSPAPAVEGPQEEYILLAWTLVSAALIGTVVAAFVLITGSTGDWLQPATAILPVLGAGIASFLLRRYAPGSPADGLPTVQAAIRQNEGTLPVRSTAGSFLASCITLAAGVSLGRETPALLAGAGITSELGRRLGMDRQRGAMLLPAGAAAGLAAAWNAPFAAVLFTLEVLIGNLRGPAAGYVILGAATSWAMMRALLGDAPLFHLPAFRFVHPVEFAFYGLLGAAAGLSSAAFGALLSRGKRWFARLPESTSVYHPLVGGLVVGLISIQAPEVLGVGYSALDAAMHGKLALQAMLLLAVLKLLASAASYSSGNAGGVIGPALFLGGMLGGAVGAFATQLSPAMTGGTGSYVLIGIGAVLAGLLQAPLTAVVLVLELTQNASILLPAVLTSGISFLIARRLQAVPQTESASLPVPANVSLGRTVGEVMLPPSSGDVSDVPETPRLYPDEPVDRALWTVAELPLEQPVRVVSRGAAAEWIGTLTRQDILRDLEHTPDPPPGALSDGKRILARTALALTALLVAITGFGYIVNANQTERDRAEFARGRELVAEGNYQEAVEPLRNSLSTPLNEEQRLVLARTLVTTNNLKDATPYLQQMLLENPTSGPANLWLARVERKTGDDDVAQQLYNRAIYGVWPAYSAEGRAEARWELADLLFKRGFDDAGAAELLHVLRESNKDYETTLRVGRRLFEQGLPDRAANVFRELLMAQPGDAAAIAGFGRSLFATGEYEMAERALEAAVRLSPNRADLQREKDLASSIVKLNPLAPRLSAIERAERFRRLRQRVMESAALCVESNPKAASTSGLAARAQRGGSAAGDIEVLEELWQTRAANCPITAADDEVLSLLFDSKAFVARQ